MDLPFFDLLMNSGPVVKGVLFMLAAASVASWAIAFEKLMRPGISLLRRPRRISRALRPLISGLLRPWISA